MMLIVVVLRLVVVFNELIDELADELVLIIVEFIVMLVVVEVVAFMLLAPRKLSVFCSFGLRIKLALSNTTIARIRNSQSL